MRRFCGGNSAGHYVDIRKEDFLSADVSREEPEKRRNKIVPFPNDSLEKQFKRFSTLRHMQPSKAKLIYETGEMLIALASGGKYAKFRSTVESTEATEILLFQTNKMFTQSLLGSYLIISDYIIDCGYPFRSFSLPSALHECLLVVDDDNRGKEITEFLVKRGFDINRQDPRDWLTPLHIAVKCQLVETVRYLLSEGADVNAVAKDDIMPLNIAENTDTSFPHYETIVNLLKGRGARSIWRRELTNINEPNNMFSSTKVAVESTNVGFRNSKDVTNAVYAGSIAIADTSTCTVEISTEGSALETSQPSIDSHVQDNGNTFSTMDFSYQCE